MKEDIYRSQFRLPYDIFEKLKARADQNRRSLNAELVACLEMALFVPESPGTALAKLDDEMAELEAKLAQIRRSLASQGINPDE